jgi:hypothetical protein
MTYLLGLETEVSRTRLRCILARRGLPSRLPPRGAYEIGFRALFDSSGESIKAKR